MAQGLAVFILGDLLLQDGPEELLVSDEEHGFIVGRRGDLRGAGGLLDRGAPDESIVGGGEGGGGCRPVHLGVGEVLLSLGGSQILQKVTLQSKGIDYY